MKHSFELKDKGKLKLKKDSTGFCWFGAVKFSDVDKLVELTIEVEGENKPTKEQVLRIAEFENNWPTLREKIFDFMMVSFQNSQRLEKREDVRNMYFLSAIDLKIDQSGWWIVFEPILDVSSIYNFLPRFTVKEMEIIWSNLK